MSKKIRVAVAGNPNSGKSTLINAIAGSRLRVGNWAGVTVEKKEAKFKYQDHQIELVDLPGIYSFSPYSLEERIARDFLLNEKCDVIINVIDSTNIERSLYLTIQLLELEIPVIIAFNIFDEASAKGIEIDLDAVEKSLNVKAVKTIATKKGGINQLLDIVVNLDPKYLPKDISYGQDLDEALVKIEEQNSDFFNNSKFPKKFTKLKICEGDKEFADDKKLNQQAINGALAHLKECHNNDLEDFISETRHSIAIGFARQIVKNKKQFSINFSKKIDAIFLNRFLSLPIFLFAMWLVFKFTFDLSSPFVDWLDMVFGDFVAKWTELFLTKINSPDWFVSLVVDGVIGGVGFVLVFVPVIFAMMFFITFLESSGYMARVAFITDRAMRAFGLHGKSFVPLLIGFGCNVPAVYATRALESFKDRVITCMVIPFMSCGARLPVYALFAAVFFRENASFIIWLLYILGIIIAALVGKLLQKFYFKHESPLFVMELPPYRIPSLKNLLIHTWEKSKHFLIKAGTYILAVSIFVWFLLNLPWGVENKKDSYLGQVGSAVAPIFRPIGFGNWETASALLTGIIAKEIIVGTMGQVFVEEDDKNNFQEYNIGNDLSKISLGFLDASKQAFFNMVAIFSMSSISFEDDGANSGLRTSLDNYFTPLTAFSFMVFTLLYMPCVITGVAMKQEFGSWKWFIISTIISFAIAWFLSYFIYKVGLWVL